MRRAAWLALFAWSTLIGAFAWLGLVLATPLLGAWPRSPLLVLVVARRHADGWYGSWRDGWFRL